MNAGEGLQFYSYDICGVFWAEMTFLYVGGAGLQVGNPV